MPLDEESVQAVERMRRRVQGKLKEGGDNRKRRGFFISEFREPKTARTMAEKREEIVQDSTGNSQNIGKENGKGGMRRNSVKSGRPDLKPTGETEKRPCRLSC